MTIFFKKIKFLFKLPAFSLSKNQLSIFFILTSSVLFFKIFCSICSLNSICEKDSNNLSSLINLFFNGFIAAYLSFFNLTICTLLVLLFYDEYNILLFSSNIVNEIFELLVSNSFDVI